MGQMEREGTWGTVAKVAIAVAVGFVVLVLFLPASGVDTPAFSARSGTAGTSAARVRA
jgi:hypothetical protein